MIETRELESRRVKKTNLLIGSIETIKQYRLF